MFWTRNSERFWVVGPNSLRLKAPLAHIHQELPVGSSQSKAGF